MATFAFVNAFRVGESAVAFSPGLGESVAHDALLAQGHLLNTDSENANSQWTNGATVIPDLTAAPANDGRYVVVNDPLARYGVYRQVSAVAATFFTIDRPYVGTIATTAHGSKHFDPPPGGVAYPNPDGGKLWGAD